MEILTLATTAIAMATPYLVKSGEKIAEEVGSSIWDLIKKPFSSTNETLTLDVQKPSELNAFKHQLIETLKSDPTFYIALEEAISKGQNLLKNNALTVNNFGEVSKQINIQDNSGSITM